MFFRWTVVLAFFLGACGESSESGTATCVISAGGVELCDGKDNDCDGDVDEGFELGGACTAGDGACSALGTFVCSDDQTGVVCDAVAPVGTAEVCDDKDNDCDGHVDEGFDVGMSCSAGTGVCTNEGVTVCDASGLTVECNAVAGSPDSEEICDGFDNNCNGLVDEGFSNLNATCRAGVGACAVEGAFVCNEAGDGTVCEGQVGEPASEICDGVDNDCDGQVDEDFPGAGAPCTVGVGVCEVSGTFVCDETGTDVMCDMTPGEPEGPEETACDNLDNDCDGMVDEGCDDDGDGYCDESMAYVGSSFCPNGLGDCEDTFADVHPGQEEVCDDRDNDCDGQADENPTDGVTYYLDCDGDGFAADDIDSRTACEPPSDLTAKTACNSAFSKWTSLAPTHGSLDCHPSWSDAFPGQTAYFSAPMSQQNAAYSDFDYDCDGSVVRKFNAFGKPTDPCPTQPWSSAFGCTIINSDPAEGWVTSPIPYCGQSGTYNYCTYTRDGTTSFCKGTRTNRPELQVCH